MVNIDAHLDWLETATMTWPHGVSPRMIPPLQGANGKPRLEAGAFVELFIAAQLSQAPRCRCYQASHPVEAVGFTPPKTQRKLTMSTYVAPPPAAT